MSEFENSGTSETEAQEEMTTMQQSVEGQQMGDAGAEPIAAPEPAVSNQEAMVAQTLSRVKKQSKQIEKANKLLAQLPGQFKDLDKKQSKQFRQVDQQVRHLQSQLKQLQKQVARIKVGAATAGGSGSKKKKKAGKKRKR
jgi:hypothetical protein